MTRKLHPSRDRRGTYYSTCEECGGHFGNGKEREKVCDECSGVVRVRAIALRMLSSHSAYYGPTFPACANSPAERRIACAMVDDFADRIKAGAVVVPDVLPAPKARGDALPAAREGVAV